MNADWTRTTDDFYLEKLRKTVPLRPFELHPIHALRSIRRRSIVESSAETPSSSTEMQWPPTASNISRATAKVRFQEKDGKEDITVSSIKSGQFQPPTGGKVPRSIIKRLPVRTETFADVVKRVIHTREDEAESLKVALQAGQYLGKYNPFKVCSLFLDLLIMPMR